jgi:hypothetical protein
MSKPDWAERLQRTFKRKYEEGVKAERLRILEGIQKIEDQSHATRTPLYQETLLEAIREVVNNSRSH